MSTNPCIAGARDSTAQALLLSPTKTYLTDDPGYRTHLRQAFMQSHVLVFPNILESRLRQLLDGLSGKASFIAQSVPKLGERRVEAPPALIGKALRATLKRPNMLQFLEDITGCGPLADIEGEVAEFSPQPLEELDWHDDRNVPARRLAITINLDDTLYEGGTFEMRTKHSKEPLIRHTHRDIGTALIFRVSAELEHRVHPVTAGGPRRVFAGWFLAP